MTRVSKQKIKRETAEAMSSQLVASILHARTKREAAILIDELLTAAERTMLAKRFAAIAMLARGYSFTQIADMLKVSIDTIQRLSRNARRGQYRHLARFARNRPKKFEGATLIDVLETMLRAGIMPPRGRGRWDNLKRWDRTSEYID